VFINKLQIHHFRNLESIEYSFKRKINIFCGQNGVGKTSILEAIHFISSGKSFRKGNFKNLITYNCNYLTVYLEAQHQDLDYVFAVNKYKNNQWKAKINHKKIEKQSDITNLIPVVSIDPEIYRLVDFGPIYRRNFLDWLVFHVKHDYLILWKKVYKCIKQLNALYKIKAPISEIDIWEKNFIIYSEELTQIRYNFFNLIQPHILSLTTEIQPELSELSIIFKKGWSDDISLHEQLLQDREKNLLYGKLQHGPHKMDLKINIGNMLASHVLSRGQKKTLSIVFYMAYIKTLLNNQINPILCLDDFDAELDAEKLSKAAQFFKQSNMQIFITSVQEDKIKKAFPDSQVFHVKH